MNYLIETLQKNGISCNFVRLDKGFTRINVKLNGIVMTMVNGMGPKISEKKVDELLGRIDYIGEGDRSCSRAPSPSRCRGCTTSL